jgi:hypothetical protein
LSIDTTSLTCLPGGTYSETSSVPLPSLSASLLRFRFKRNLSRESCFLLNVQTALGFIA